MVRIWVTSALKYDLTGFNKYSSFSGQRVHINYDLWETHLWTYSMSTSLTRKPRTCICVFLKKVSFCDNFWIYVQIIGQLSLGSFVWYETSIISSESCLVCILSRMFIPEDGRFPTRKLAQLIPQKLRFTFAFPGRSIKLRSNQQRI